MSRIVLASLIFLTSLTAFSQYSGEIDLASADAIFLGENAGDLAGHHVSFIGDINKDGHDDFIITAPLWDKAEDSADNGQAYLYYGKGSGWNGYFDLNEADAKFYGELSGNEVAHDAFGIGDINNDGIDDFAIGIKKTQGAQGGIKLGKVYIFFGSTQKRRGSNSIDIADASLVGDYANAEAAHIKGVGDLDNDGYDDFIIGSGFDPQIGVEAGKVYVFFGKPKNQWGKNVQMENAADATFLAEAAYDWAGHRVSALGDVNNDGKADFLIGANNYDNGEELNNGKAYLILGKARNLWQKNVSLSQSDASWIGPAKQGLGWNVAQPGDLDGDGKDDILIGEKKTMYYLLLGRNINYTNNQSAEMEADAIISHRSKVWDNIGHDISSLGDLNGDGYDDFLIGSSNDDVDGQTVVGRSFLLWGKPNWQKTIYLEDADAIFIGDNANDASGFSLSGDGDANGDGLKDILISAYAEDEGGLDAGKVFLFLTQPPKLTLAYPNGDETFYVGETHNIRWITDPDVNQVKIEYTSNLGTNWTTIANNYPDNGSYPWTIPNTPSTKCLVRISDAADGNPNDVSNAVFTISDESSITVLSPNGGESWDAGSTHNIQWTSNSLNENIKIELSTNGGSTWETVDMSAPNTGTYTWLVPQTESNNCFIRLSGATTTTVSDESDAPFSITGSGMSVYREEAENMNLSASIEIQDRAGASNGKVTAVSSNSTDGTLTYTFAYPDGEYGFLIKYLDENDGIATSTISVNGQQIASWRWEETQINGADTWRIKDLGKKQLKQGDTIVMWILRNQGEYGRVDYFDFEAPTTDPGEITVVAPNGGETWEIGTRQKIEWTSANTSGNVKIDISRDNGATWIQLAGTATDNGEYLWDVVGPASANCRIRVTDSDGTPFDLSDVSFSIIAAQKPEITITAPNGGEQWEIGTNKNITWTSENAGGVVKIDLSRDNGATWQPLSASTPNNGSFAWTVTAPSSETCLVRIADLANTASDSSDAVFTIFQKPETKVTVTAPNGGEEWQIGTLQNISWTSENAADQLKIDISRDNGTTWQDIVTTANDGAYSWVVAGPESESCLIRVTDNTNSVADTSDAVFTIYEQPPAKITVVLPNGGEKWIIGTSKNIRWQSENFEENVKIDLSRDNGTNWQTLANDILNSGEWQYTVAGPESQNCLVRVASIDMTVSDVSDSVFSILETPEIAVTSPNGGEMWEIGSKHMINWTSKNISSQVKIDVSRDSGQSWKVLSQSAPNNGSYSWTISEPASENCLVRVSDISGTPSDTSDAEFSITTPVYPVISIVSPNGGENWKINSEHEISWVSENTSGKVTIELTRDGESWEVIDENAEDIGAYLWTVTEPASELCLIKISDAEGEAADTSDTTFTISEGPEATISVISPNGGEKWEIGFPKEIKWSSENINGNVKISISRDNGTSWNIFKESAVNSGTYSWIVQGPISESCLIKVSSLDGTTEDTSDMVFSIIETPAIAVTAPNGGENWQIGSQHDITWTSVNSSGSVYIQLTRDNGASWEEITDRTNDTGLYSWQVTEPASSTCLILISDVNGMPIDLSDGVFTISAKPSITVTVPNGGEQWDIGSSQTINWEGINIGNNVKIELSRDNGTNWEFLENEALNSGQWSWTVSGPISTNCLVRITNTAGDVIDISDSPFEIKNPTGVARLNDEIPDNFSLDQNYPNPFNPVTRIVYQIAKFSHVTMSVYNVHGSLISTIVNESQTPGTYMVTWNGRDMNGQQVSSGVYFYRLVTEYFTTTKRMMLMK